MHHLLLLQTESTWCLLLAIGCRSRNGAADHTWSTWSRSETEHRKHVGNRTTTTLLHAWQTPNSQSRVENIKAGLCFPCSHLQFDSPILQFVITVYALVQSLPLNTDVTEDVNNELISGGFGCRLITSLSMLHMVQKQESLIFCSLKVANTYQGWFYFFFY